MNPVKIEISTKTIIVGIAVLISIWFIYQTKEVFLLLFASFIIASALYPVVDWLSKKMSRGLAVFLIYVLGFIVLATMLIPFFAILIQQAQEFIKQIPVYWSEVEHIIANMKIISQNIALIPDLQQIVSATSFIGQHIVDQSINLTVNVFTGFVAVFTLAILVLFMLMDKAELKEGFLKFFPEHMREKTESIAITISGKVGGYVRGQLLLMLIVGILTSLVLFVLGIKFALLLGMLAGVLEIIPVVGPILSAIPAVIIALVHDPWLALWTILAYLVIQRFENSLLTPLILGRFLELHPLIIIFAILVSASTLGILGVILSPPIAASIYVLVQELYLKKINPEK